MSVFKIINGPNDKRTYLAEGYDYITDKTKTGNGRYIGTIGCSHSNPVRDMLITKKLWNKTHGKQGIHFVISFTSENNEIDDNDYMKATHEIISAAFPDYQCFFGLHLDSAYKHTHSLLNAVNSKNGKKISISKNELNRIKLIANSVLEKFGFDIIKTSSNDFVDTSDYSSATDYHFFELNENDLNYEADILSEVTKTTSLPSSAYLSCSGLYRRNNNMNLCEDVLYFNKSGDTTMKKTSFDTEVKNSEESTSIEPATINSPAGNSQDMKIMEINPQKSGGYPTVAITGPIIRINSSYANDIGENLISVIERSINTANETRKESANIAYAFNKNAQEAGTPANIICTSAPIFEINFSAPSNEIRFDGDLFSDEDD